MRVERHPYAVPGWGVGEVWVREGLVVQHELPSEGPEPRAAGAGAGPRDGASPAALAPDGGPRVPARTLPPDLERDGAEIVTTLCRRVAAHLGGEPTSYEDVEIDLEWATAFQRDLARAARSIPWGEVVSYGELAALAGRPGAARAAGSFCADNRYALIVPCHRIVAANGIGGYGTAGPALKRRLLALEGVRM